MLCCRTIVSASTVSCAISVAQKEQVSLEMSKSPRILSVLLSHFSLITFPFLFIKIRFSFREVILACSATAQGIAVPHSHVVHEKPDFVSSKHWVKRGKLPSDVHFPMRIELAQRNLHRGQKFLIDV